MLSTSSRASHKAIAVIGLVLSCYALSSRYYTSAAFERSVHLTVVTLLFNAIVLAILTRWKSYSPSLPLTVFKAGEVAYSPVVKNGNAIVGVLNTILQKAQSIRLSFCVLLGTVGTRTLLFWYITRTSQCSLIGVEAFLPLSVLIFDAILSDSVHLLGAQPKDPGHSKGMGRFSWMSRSLFIYAFLALAWGFSAAHALGNSRIDTGTICPIGWRLEPLVPYAQLIMCAVDGIIVVLLTRMRRQALENDQDVSNFMNILLLTASCTITLLSFPSWLSDSGFLMSFRFHYADVRDLAVDGFLASTGCLCGFSLLAVLHPTTIALLISTVSFAGMQVAQYKSSLSLPPLSFNHMAKTTSVAACWAGPVWYYAFYSSNKNRQSVATPLHRWLLLGYVWIIAFGIACWMLFSGQNASVLLEEGVNTLISVARTNSNQWASQAFVSKTLNEAVEEYKKRYGIPPPPNFDKWYDFATEHESPVIDDFGQINDDLLPFWGLDPKAIRVRTSHLLSYSRLEMGGLRIRNGTLQLWPDIPGSHRWMAESFQNMVDPFVKWLPDMDIALNLADECRMAIPFEEMKFLKDKARETRSRIGTSRKEQGDLGKNASPGMGWSGPFPEEGERDGRMNNRELPSGWTDNIRQQIFYDSIAASCPPGSKARNSRWWDWSTLCVECMMPHSLATSGGALLSDASLAHDLCHQPDMAYLNGLLHSPSALVSTSMLFPIFSQGRVGGFSDILLPSPWNFNEKSAFNETAGMEWSEKSNSLFWRGSSSDGFAAHGAWEGFLRARFVHEAYEKAKSLSKTADDRTSLSVNVSFTGGMSRCDQGDCDAELDVFELWGKEVGQDRILNGKKPEDRLPPFIPFDEHWRFRHLMDMDGAGFSGRFLPFMKSRSLVYRAALFRAWFDERIQAWQHYVPVDARLGLGFWSLLDYFSGSHKLGKDILSRTTGGADGGGTSGDERARDIAEQGREWAHKALRKEDMQIYTFRLLLEWGRLVDDDREHLGFHG